MYNKQEIYRIIGDYSRQAKKPFIIEVLGTPNSGKTTAIQTFEKVLKRSNIKYKIIYEFAGKCKIKDKLSPDFTLWTMSETIRCLIEVFKKNYDVVICERGILDTICWCQLFLDENKLSKIEYETIVNYVKLDRFVRNISYSYVMKCNEEISLKRENLDDLLDEKGTIVNEEIVLKYNNALGHVITENKDSFEKIEMIDTSNLTQTEINKAFVHSILEYLENTKNT